MKKLSYLFLSLAALAFVFVSCDKEEKPDVDDIVEDGFYVVGEATASTKLVNTAIMAAGINEEGQVAREGMYEKYIALEAGKSFSLLLKEGVVETKYGATLEAVELGGADEQPDITVLKGTLAENAALQVEESGLYHIVLDLNLENDLEDALILIAPVEWGMRGDINGWGFTAMEASEFNKESMTFTLTDVEIARTQSFKFAYGGGWKIQLDAEGFVKANTNLGEGMVPGGDHMGVEENGVYDVTLTWTLKQGSVSDNYSVEFEKKGTLDLPDYPETVYMIGSSIGGWDWSGDYIIELTPVHSHPHAFWTVAYIEAPAQDPGFKFSPVKDWNGDFGKSGDAVDGVFSKGGENLTVTEAGYYMVYVDLKAEKISVTAPEVYLIGKTIGDVWDYAAAAGKFTVDNTAKTITSPAVQAGELRMYATCPLSQLDTPAADWWQMEFIVLDGKIVYRGTGDDQERVAVTAGQKVTLDFNAGTGTIR